MLEGALAGGAAVFSGAGGAVRSGAVRVRDSDAGGAVAAGFASEEPEEPDDADPVTRTAQAKTQVQVGGIIQTERVIAR